MSQLGGGARKLSRVGVGGLSMVFFSFWLGRLARRYLGSNLCRDHTTMQWRGHTIKGIFRYSLTTWVVDVIFPRSSLFIFHLLTSFSTSLSFFVIVLNHISHVRSFHFFEVFPIILFFQLPFYLLSWFWVRLPMCHALNIFSPYFILNEILLVFFSKERDEGD